MIKSFPKIFAIGTDYIADIFKEEVEITEKVDGSQFAFGRINGEVYMRSKGAMLYRDNPEKMFEEAIDYVCSIEHSLPEGIVFYAEYLKRQKHNTLKYDKIPKNHLSLFAVRDFSRESFGNDLAQWADFLDIDHVPILFVGMVDGFDHLQHLLAKESYLGGAEIEGIVAKNYHRKFLLGGQPMPIMAGKFVSERFKEVHRGRWEKEENKKSRLEVFFGSFRTEARWEKAVQHLRDSGKLVNEPRDIGALIKEVQADIIEEEKEAIKDFLWSEFYQQVTRKATAGLPQWYKDKLARKSLDNPEG